MTSSVQHILQLSLQDLESLMSEYSQPRFRAKQIYEWVHTKHVLSFDDMTNIPAALRQQLKDRFYVTTVHIVDKRTSRDGTRKYILKLEDGNLIETVGIPVYKDQASPSAIQRLTVCFSTQVGCPMACQFCATGKEGFIRNLTEEEILSQISIVARDFNERVSNIVAMGQGEPFLNYQTVLAAFKKLNDADEFGIGARHITVSTCGITEGILKLSTEPKQFNLAVSLHSAIQETRDEIMPSVASIPLSELKKALQTYTTKTNRRVTFEYLLIEGVNDSEKHLKALIDYCKDILCYVNLLPMNDIPGSPYKATKQSLINHWKTMLTQAGIETAVRDSRGSDIDGACGQLKNSFSVSSHIES